MISFAIGDLVKHISLKNPLRYGFISGNPYTNHTGLVVVHAIDPFDETPTIFNTVNIVKNYGVLTFDEFKEQYPEEQI